MSPRPRPDFIQIRLSAHGRRFAGPRETLLIHTAHMRYAFEGQQPVEVLRFAEWPVLRRECDFAGNPLFEVAEMAAPAPVLPAPIATAPFPDPSSDSSSEEA